MTWPRTIWHPPIRQKISFIVMLTTICALVLACGGLIVYDFGGFRRATARDLDTLAEVVASNSAAGLIFRDVDASREILAGVRARSAIVAGAIYAQDGSPFVTYGNGPIPATASKQRGLVMGREIIEVWRTISFRGEPIGTIYLASDLRDVKQRMRVQILAASGILAATLLVALAITGILQRLVTRPLVDLAHAAKRVTAEKNYAVRVAEHGGPNRDEIGVVMHAFNDMLIEIGSRDDALRIQQADLERQVLARTTELRATAEANAELGRHNQTILDSAGDGIFGLDPFGIVTFINPSAARILGGEVEDLVGRDFHARAHPREGEGKPPAIADCPICGSAVSPAVRVGRGALRRGSDGEAIPIEYTSSTIFGEGAAPTGVVVTFRDITERLVVEKMKDEFISTVSHELRTPLTSIRGALGLLSTGRIGDFPPTGKRMLEIALTNTNRLARLIDDILDLEKMDSGKVKLNQTLVGIDDLMAQAAETMQPMAERAGIRIDVQAAPLQVMIDPDRILQMLINLISNAIKFSPADTVVRLVGSIDRDRNHYIVAVRDEGRGVPADKLEMIFQRFQQANASDSRDRGGTGLGLAICRTIADAHGGTISARLGEKVGTIFTFTLPFEQPPIQAPAMLAAG